MRAPRTVNRIAVNRSASSRRETGATIYNQRERGMSAWPFVLALLGFIIMSYLWFTKSDDAETATEEIATLKTEISELKGSGQTIIDYATKLSELVGYRDGNLQTGKLGTGSVAVTNLEMLTAHVKPGGQVSGGEDGAKVPGTRTQLRDEAVLKFTREGRIHADTTGDEKKFDFQTLPQAIRDKVAAFEEKWADGLPPRPAPPSDPDDTEGQARYESELSSFDEKFNEYWSDLGDLQNDDDFGKVDAIITLGSTWADASSETIEVTYVKFPEGGEETVETLLAAVVPTIKGLKAEVKSMQKAAVARITALTSETKAKQTELDNANQQLQTEQGEFTAELERITGELSTATERVTALNQEKADIAQELANVKETSANELKAANAETNRYRTGWQGLKNKRDHEKRRDDPKGEVLAASPTLRTGMINKGQRDKVVIGQIFTISSIDRGSNRINKGRVQITHVTHNTAKFRILESDGTISTGDRIHNFLYNPSEPIHVVIPKKLDKWPMGILKSRLGNMGVVVQDSINGMTDYIVVPNSMTIVPDTGGEDDEEEEGAGGPSPLERLESQARKVGAKVITERLFDVFLDF